MIGLGHRWECDERKLERKFSNDGLCWREANLNHFNIILFNKRQMAAVLRLPVDPNYFIIYGRRVQSLIITFKLMDIA